MCTEANQGHSQGFDCNVELGQGSVTGYKGVFNDSEQALTSALAQQPVSTAIEADQALFQLYSSGVLIVRHRSRPRCSGRRERNSR